MRNTSWAFQANVICTLALFAQSIVIGRVLGPTAFGVYTLLVAFVETVQEFLNLNLDTAVTKYASEFRARSQYQALSCLIKIASLCAFATYIVSVSAVLLLSWTLEDLLQQTNGLTFYAVLLALGRGIVMFDTISMSILRVFDKFKFNSRLRIGHSLTELVLLMLAVLLSSNFTVATLVYVLLAVHILRGLILNGAAFWKLRRLPVAWPRSSFQDLRGRYREMFRFTIENSLSRSIKELKTRGDTLILGALADPAAVGFYAVAKKLSLSVLSLTDPLYNAVYPQLSRMAASRSFFEIRQLLREVTLTIGSVVLLAVLVLGLFGKSIIQMAFGAAYLSSYMPLLVLLIGGSVSALFFWITPLVLSLGLTTYRLKIDGLIAILEMTLAAVLVPFLGPIGSAIAASVDCLLLHSLLLLKIRTTWSASKPVFEGPTSDDRVPQLQP
jgi:O-antigen/teichoic acid export membrane protein